MPRVFDDSQLCYRLGAYGHRSFAGLHQETRTHEPTCVLLNDFVKLVFPSHKWTTLSVNVDSQASPHRDRQNFGLSLVNGVSHFATVTSGSNRLGVTASRSLWGTSPGRVHGRQWSCCSFRCKGLLTCSSPGSLSSEHRAQLLALGFQPPHDP